MQCLHRKGENWRPEPGDREESIAAKHCYVTGITKGRDYEGDVSFKGVKRTHGMQR